MEEKEILGYRDKFEIKNMKSTNVAIILTCVLIFGLFSYFGIVNGIEWFLIGLGLSAIVFLTMPLMNHFNNVLKRKDEWPIESIYYVNGKIYIDQANLEVIDCRDILKVTNYHNTNQITYGTIGSSVEILPEGTIIIKTKDKKTYYAENIKNAQREGQLCVRSRYTGKLH